jgi:hypothetical protein
MLTTGREIISEHQTILNRLGESQKFLKSLLSLGTAVSEVRDPSVIKPIANLVDMKAAPCSQSRSRFHQRPSSGKYIIPVKLPRPTDVCSAPRGAAAERRAHLAACRQYSIHDRLRRRCGAIRENIPTQESDRGYASSH